MSKNNKIATTVFSVSGIILFGKALGFIKQMIIASAFGATIQTDIISLSEGLIDNTDFLLIHALATAFIPIYIHIKADNPLNCKRFVSDTLKVSLIITASITLLFIICSPVVSKILAPTYSPELSSLLAKYIKIFSPTVIFLVSLAIFSALLKANESFIPGELTGSIRSVILIVLVLTIGEVIGPDTLVFGVYAYAVICLIMLMLLSRKYWRIQSGNPFKNQDVRQLLIMMGPLILGYSMIFVNEQVDKIIVSGLGEGSVTAMSYASSLFNLITKLTGSICGVLFTYIAQNIATKKDDAGAILATNSAIQMITVLLPISVITICNATDIVSLIFGRGKFDPDAVKTCSYALVGYAFMFAPYAMREMFSRVQYAYGDSKRPMINSTVGICFNIGSSVFLSRFWGVFGVAFASSVSVIVCGCLNVYSSRKLNKYLSFDKYAKVLPKWIIGIVACLGISIAGQAFLSDIQIFWKLVIITLLTCIVYFAITYSIIKPLLVLMRSKL